MWVVPCASLPLLSGKHKHILLTSQFNNTFSIGMKDLQVCLSQPTCTSFTSRHCVSKGRSLFLSALYSRKLL